MIENPFVFGKTVHKGDFSNCKDNMAFLHQQFNTNTILISPI